MAAVFTLLPQRKFSASLTLSTTWAFVWPLEPSALHWSRVCMWSLAFPLFLSHQHTLLYLCCYACLHQFPLSELTISPSLLPTFPSSPRLPRTFSYCMDTILSSSSHLSTLPFYIPSLPQDSLPFPNICLSLTFPPQSLPSLLQSFLPISSIVS